ncbi:MAG: GspH/FimT family protein [Thermodesulfobacteriota bacterium]
MYPSKPFLSKSALDSPSNKNRWEKFILIPLSSGYSLVEVIIVIAIIGIMCTAAVPGVNSMMRSYRLKSAAQDLSSTLQRARMAAMAQNANSVLIFDVAGQTLTVFSDNGAGGATANDGAQSGGEPTVTSLNIRNEYSQEITMGTPTFGLTNFFNSQGVLNTGGSIQIQNSGGSSKQVVISPSGAIGIT